MKIAQAWASVALILSSTPAISAEQMVPAFAGKWSLDLSSMPIPPEARPASVTVAFQPEGLEGLRTTFVITAKDGSERRMVSHEKLDGVAVPIEGDQLEADSAALLNPAPNVLVIGLSKNGRPGSVRIYTVSSDGTSLTESAANVGDDGKPFIRRFRWFKAD
jgi:hypothetical protein